MGQLYDGTWIYLNPIPLLEDNNITAPIQKIGRVLEWFTNKEKGWMNASSNLLNIYKCTLYYKGNTCVVIFTPVIELKF